jgi:ribonuclease HI
MKIDQTDIPDLVIYTDGSAINNGRKNCIAGYGVYCPDGWPSCYTGRVLTHPSNQRAELVAIDRALELAGETGWKGSVLIVTDSMYAINALTKWAKGWEKTGWVTKKGLPVKHSDLIRSCLARMTKEVRFVHFLAHRTPQPGWTPEELRHWRGNRKADALARRAVESPLEHRTCAQASP